MLAHKNQVLQQNIYFNANNNTNLINTNNWQLWCRLCGADNINNNTCYDLKTEMQKSPFCEVDLKTTTNTSTAELNDVSVEDMLIRYFNIELTQNVGLPNQLCHDCYKILTSLVYFTVRVAKVQELFDKLFKMQQSDLLQLNLQELREQFGLESQTQQDLIINLQMKQPRNQTVIENQQINVKVDTVSKCDEKTIINNKKPKRNFNSIKHDDEKLLMSSLTCTYCKKKFKAKSSLDHHIKTLHMQQHCTYICEECGISVRTNGALKEHMLIHTDYAPFECEICKKTFKNQIRLKNHMETHDANKHICAKCGLQLNSRATLNRHLLVHTEELTHKCDYCGRAFKRTKALKNHLLLHTGLKPYNCDFCDRTFANGSNCRSHKKKAHPKELAALEAAGGIRTYTKNIPKLETLKAVTKAADNLTPVVSKQSGRFAFGKKPKLQLTKEISTIQNEMVEQQQTPRDFIFTITSSEAAKTLNTQYSSSATFTQYEL